jgi:hypothetical protein
MNSETYKQLADALLAAGFLVKKLEAEIYNDFTRPASGKKYTGEFNLRIRSVEDENKEVCNGES